MESSVSIVMYHYVRALPFTRYPNIKGLDTSLFKEQLEYFSRHCHFVGARDVIAAVYEEKPLPENAVWLTFDDGFMDHYETVFPILDGMGIEGAFFPPAYPMMHHKVLDVHKLHFILASVDKTDGLLKDIDHLLDTYREKYDLHSRSYYYEKLARESRFDSKDTIYIKRLLQAELPKELRHIITSVLFEKYVSCNEDAFSRELYMSVEQLRCMVRHGMYVGSHGNEHLWLDSIAPDLQRADIDASIEFLQHIGTGMDEWIMCYPYGAYNDSLLGIVKERGFKLGLSTKPARARLYVGSAFCLPRYDTNDFPKSRNAEFFSG